jgi:hypothetical protein
MDSLIVVLLAGGVGLWLIIRPSTMLGWVQQNHPDVPLDKNVAFVIIRAIAGVMLILATLILISTLRSVSP